MTSKSKTKLGIFKRSIPLDMYVLDHKKSWITLSRVLLSIGLFIGLSYALDLIAFNNIIYYPLKLILSFFTGLSIVGLFVIGHDCGHYSFHESKRVNDIVGVFAFTPLLNSFFAWRVFHNFHHINTQVKGVDPDWPELLLCPLEMKNAKWYDKLAIKVGLGTPVGLLLGFWVGMIKRFFFFLLIPALNFSRKKKLILITQNLFCAGLSVGFLYFLLSILSTSEFMWWYLLPSIIAATIGAFLTWIQHTQEDSYVFDKDNYDAFHAQVLSSYNIHFPKFIEWFWLDINIHMPHHVSTRIPWYSLKACLNDIRDKRPDCIKEERFTFKMIGRNLKMIHLSKMESHSFWQLTPKKGNH